MMPSGATVSLDESPQAAVPSRGRDKTGILFLDDHGGGKRRAGIEKSPNRSPAGASCGEGGFIPLQKAAWATFVDI